MTKGKQVVLLAGSDRSYLVRCCGKFSCKYGALNLDKLAGKKFGSEIKIGSETFTILKPNVLDVLEFSKRGPQVVLPKDSAAIASITGCGVGWKVLDAGSGSGFNAIFLANLGCDVLTVEKDRNFFKVAEKNISVAKEILPLEITIKNSSVEKFFRKNYFDLIFLDLQNAEKFVKKSFASLKHGGWVAAYALQSEDLPKISKEVDKNFGNRNNSSQNFSVRENPKDFHCNKKIIEVLNREWQSKSFGKKTFTRPKTWMMGHTGFLIFARKI